MNAEKGNKNHLDLDLGFIGDEDSTRVADEIRPLRPSQNAQSTGKRRLFDRGAEHELMPEEKPAPKPPVQVDLSPTRPNEQQNTSVKVHPWMRHFARLLDVFLFSALIGAFGLIPEDANDMLLAVIVLAAWIPIEALLISTWGTTPGKWMFNTVVRDSEGQKLDFSKAFNRSGNVYVRGIGLGIPIITLFTEVAAYNKLTKEGATSWDQEKGYKVIHNKISALKLIVSILVIVVVVIITVGITSS